MDYSVKGILMMLQDLQRIYFGKFTMLVNVYMSDDSDPIVNGCIFDKDGEPQNFYFYTFDSEDKRKEEYNKVLKLINKINNG